MALPRLLFVVTGEQWFMVLRVSYRDAWGYANRMGDEEQPLLEPCQSSLVCLYIGSRYILY